MSSFMYPKITYCRGAVQVFLKLRRENAILDPWSLPPKKLMKFTKSRSFVCEERKKNGGKEASTSRENFSSYPCDFLSDLAKFWRHGVVAI